MNHRMLEDLPQLNIRGLLFFLTFSPLSIFSLLNYIMAVNASLSILASFMRSASVWSFSCQAGLFGVVDLWYDLLQHLRRSQYVGFIAIAAEADKTRGECYELIKLSVNVLWELSLLLSRVSFCNIFSFTYCTPFSRSGHFRRRSDLSFFDVVISFSSRILRTIAVRLS